MRGAKRRDSGARFPIAWRERAVDWNPSTQHLEMKLGPEGEGLIDSLAMEFVRIEAGTFHIG